MPRVTVDFPGLIIPEMVTRYEFMTDLREIVAPHMDGLNYEGEPLGLVADHVNVILRPHESGDVLSDSLFMFEIYGYDYPERMDQVAMKKRLTSIAVDVHDLVNPYVNQALAGYEGELNDYMTVRKQHLVSVEFFSYHRGSWASSS